MPGNLSPTASVKTPQLVSIQVLRAFGLSLIVFVHVAIAIVRTVYPDAYPAWVRDLSGCRSAIDMFFVFSGFIMVYIAHGEFGQRGAALPFFLFRLTRIVPVYWIYTLLALLFGVVFPVGLGFQEPSFEVAWKSFLFIPYEPPVLPLLDVDSMTVYPALVVGWTLNYEIIFYVLFALCMRFPLRTGLMILSGLALVLALVHTVCPPDLVLLYFWTSAMLWKFVMGTWIGYAYVRGMRFNAVPAWLASVFIVVAFVALFSLYVIFINADTMSFHALSGLLAALTLAGATLTRLEHATAPRWIVRIGDASYSTYLSHYFIVVVAFVLMDVFVKRSLPASIVAGVGVFVLALYAGELSYRKIELPLMQYFRSRLRVNAGRRPVA